MSLLMYGHYLEIISLKAEKKFFLLELEIMQYLQIVQYI